MITMRNHMQGAERLIRVNGITAAQARKLSKAPGFIVACTRAAAADFDATPAALAAILAALPKLPITIDDRLFDLLRRAQIAPLAPIPAAPILANVKTQPWPWQAVGTGYVLANFGALLAADMGTGKSKMLIDAFQNDIGYRYAPDHSMLIIAPKAVVLNWPREMAAHATFDNFLAVDVSASVQARAHQIMAYGGPASDVRGRVLIVDHATCWRDPIAHLLLGYHWDFIAVDEAHRIGNPDNQLSKLCYALAEANPTARRVAMTGTPMNKPLDIYGIARFVAPDSVGQSKWAFDHRYGTFKTKNVRVGKGAQARDMQIEVFDRLTDPDKFAALLATFTYRVRKSDTLKDLPEQTHTRRYATLTPSAALAYRKLCRELAVEYQGHTFSAEYASTLQMRCQQFTGAYKADILGEVLENAAGAPLVIFARFVDDLAVIRAACEKAGLAYLEQSGRATQWQQFQDGAGDVLGVQIQSGGAGVNLTRSSHGIYYSHGRSNNDYDQSLSRLHRPGQHHPVMYTHLIVDGTVDDLIVDAVVTGRDIAQALLHATQKKQTEKLKNAA